MVFFYALFWVFNSLLFRWSGRRLLAGPDHDQAFSTSHARRITFSSAVGVGLYTALVYFCDLKYYLLQFAVLRISSFVLYSTGIALYFILLVIIWSCAFPAYKQSYDTRTTRTAYLSSHLRLNGALILPWLIFSLLYDLFGLLPPGISAMLADSGMTYYVIFPLCLVCLACFFPWVLIKVWSCEPLPRGPLRERLESFARQSHFDCADIVVWNLFDGKLITAGVVGIVRKFRYLMLSPTLLSVLDEHELKSVVAHEIGHVKKRHLIFYLVFVLGYTVFAYGFFNIAYFGLMTQDVVFDFFMHESGELQPGFYLLPIGLLLVFIVMYFRVVFGAFSRNFERQADAFALKLIGDASGIISSLEKIAVVGAHNRTAPNWHHFSIQERIDFLRQCQDDRGLVRRHDRKVARMIGGYCMVLVAVVALLYGLNTTVLKNAETDVLQKLVEKKIEAEPGNSSLILLLANIYFEKKLYKKAEQQYIRALSIKPDNPEALNNLAWLYATSEDAGLRNPSKALDLALTAARIEPRPYILDTLAESYFINGYYEEAIDIERLAIAGNPDNISYYRKQLKKFQESAALKKKQDLQRQKYPSISI